MHYFPQELVIRTGNFLSIHVRGEPVLIRVMYKDGKFDMVRPKMLDNLLEEDKITGFMRSTGWVFVGRDAIRRGGAVGYWGEEQREV